MGAAKRLLQTCLRISPHQEKYWLDFAYVCVCLGDDELALSAYHKAISINVNCSSAYNGIAVIEARRGNIQSAIQILRRSVSINPEDTVSYGNLARILDNAGRSKDALKIYLRILKYSPTLKNYESTILTYRKLGMLELATSTCLEGLEKYPRQISLKRLLFQLEKCPIHISAEVDEEVKIQLEESSYLINDGELESSGKILSSIYEKYPYHPLILYNYGLFCLQHTEGKRLQEALLMLENTILVVPEFTSPYKLLADHFFQQRDFDYVIMIVEESFNFNQSEPSLYHILALSLHETGQFERAITVLKQGIEKAQEHSLLSMYNDLAMIYAVDGQFAKSRDFYEMALKIDPLHEQVRFNYGLLLCRSGMINESIKVLESLSSLDQNSYEALLYAIACHPQKYRELPKYLVGWAEKYAGNIKKDSVDLPINKKKEKIRVGYVSPDFRRHPVAYFMTGPYTCHNKKEFEIYSYYNGTDIDDYTLHLKEHSDVWRDVKSLSDNDLIQQIRHDQIDILVDLAGHTSNNRLRAFVAKPAPIQITYLGYLATTGIEQIDYRLIDSYAAPDVSTEELIELPNCYLCFQPLHLDVSTSLHAQTRNRHVTFGSFHRLPKIHPQLINNWSKILLKVPGSVLMMKTRYLDAVDIQIKLLEQFSRNGITPERIIFEGHADSFVDHLSAYDRIDLMLDAFPYNGTTITCESLWMGVPVVTLAGDLHLSRVGHSINTNAGLSDLVGESESDYVRIAVELANDEKRLLTYNQTLRNQFLNSQVCDSITFTKNLEKEYKKMYKKRGNQN
ncbi:MAG: hypothetical protein CMJ75_04170 [Planctomycetaceae bacterium]|nr:hypothetical protein [Planctomycetaceae bacterium]